MGVPGIVILRNTGWLETLNGNCNVLAKPDGEDILQKVNNIVVDRSLFGKEYYGDGTAACQISKILSRG